jgi:hypothetical protein
MRGGWRGCMEDLQQPDGGSVTTIAFRWGFCDTAFLPGVQAGFWG